MAEKLALSPQVFTILSGLVEDRTGLHYGADDRELFAERVTPRALERGFDSLLDYYYFLRYDPEAELELAQLVESLVVNETYFFRELGALKVIVDTFVRERVATGARPRLWCAAASTGEEPLTLAMLLEEAGLLDKVGLVASDISERALAHARAGYFSRRSLRALPSWVVGRMLTVEGEGVRALPHLLAAVEWKRVNLVEPREVAALGTFDIILCRNVLIYFRDETVHQVLEHLWGNLAPNGRLAVGASESLLRFGGGRACEEVGGAFFYRKGER